MPDTDPCIKFGKTIRSIRTKRGLSQEALADASGLDRTYVSAVERGKRNISLRNIYKLARALGVKAGDLLKEK